MIETFANGRVRSWASVLDDVTRKQAEKLAELKIITEPIALMPDAHLGHGATIGSVIVTENAVIPMAVGVDIGCGMAARKLNIKSVDLDKNVASRWVLKCGVTIPAGLGNWYANAMSEAGEWMAANGLPARLDRTGAFIKAVNQLGTLGSGNHFIELAVDDEDFVWLLLHSGSRGSGNVLAQIHAKVALELHEKDVPLAENGKPERDLAWLDSGTDEFELYLADLNWSQNYALENRRLILTQAHHAFDEVSGAVEIVEEINCHHNYAQFEPVREVGDYRFVTRKGAISAAKGARGLIPDRKSVV